MAAAAKAAEDAAEAIGARRAEGRAGDGRRRPRAVPRAGRAGQGAAGRGAGRADRRRPADGRRTGPPAAGLRRPAGQAGAKAAACGNQPQKPMKDQQQPGVGQKPAEEAGRNKCRASAAMAEKIAEKAKTLADVLGAAAKADGPRTQAVGQEGRRTDERARHLPSVTERLKNLPGQVGRARWRTPRPRPATAPSGWKRRPSSWPACTGSIVAPRVDELAKLEQQLVQLDESSTSSTRRPRSPAGTWTPTNCWTS